MSEDTQATPMMDTSTQRTQEGSFSHDLPPRQYHVPPTDVGSHDHPAPHVASPTHHQPTTQTTLPQKNSPPQQHHARKSQAINSLINSDTDGNNSSIQHLLLLSNPQHNSPQPIDAESTRERQPPVTSTSSSDAPSPSPIKVIKEPLQPDVELPEQAHDRSPDNNKDTLKNLNSKRQLPDSIPTELDSKKVKRNELLMNEVNEQHAHKILSKLLKDPWAPPFETPVDPDMLNLPDYFDVIKRPMDLGTIAANLNEKRYSTVTAFSDDVRLVFNNAILYNAVRSDIHKAARNFIHDFDELVRNTPWDQAYDTKIPEVTMPIVAISKGSKPTPSMRTEIAEVTHIEEPRSLVSGGSPPSPPLSSKYDRSRNGSHPRTGSKHGYNCLVYYQNEAIPYDFEWQQLHTREEFEQKLRSALNLTSMVELEIGIKRSKPNFGREVFVQLSPRWEEFPRVSCILVKHKKQ